MSEWEPATDAERAMRDALRTDDQESYFRILAGVDLLLPVSADALAGLAPLGWGTWSTGGRTHVLAFTSPSALQACLADYTGSARRVAYAELADTWPNLEWWLAVNPGLPIEGYLPAWFVAQLSRGDVRLPKRGPGRETQDLAGAALGGKSGSSQQGGPMPPTGGAAPAGGSALAGGSAAAGAMAGAASGGLPGAGADSGFRPDGDGGFRPGAGAFPPDGPEQKSGLEPKRTPGAAAAFGNRPPRTTGGGAAPAASGAPGLSGGPATPSGGITGTRMGGPAAPALPSRVPTSSPASAPPSFPGAPTSAAPASGPPGFPSAPTSAAPASAPPSFPSAAPASAPPSFPSAAPASAAPSFSSAAPSSFPGAPPAPTSGPGGLPTRSPSGEPGQSGPGGLPTRTPSGEPAQSGPGGLPTRSPSGEPAQGGLPARGAPQRPGERNPSGEPGQVGPGGLPIRNPGAVLPSGLPSRVPQASQTPTGTAGSGFVPGGYGRTPGDAPADAVPAAYSPPSMPAGTAPSSAPPSSPGAPGALPTRGAPASGAPTSGPPSSLNTGPAGDGSGPSIGGLPRRTVPTGGGPADNAPISGAAPGGRPVSGVPAGPGAPTPTSGPPGALPPLQDLKAPLPTRTPMAQTPPVPGHLGAAPSTPDAAPPGLPRRQPGETPPSMAAAAQSLSGSRTAPPTEAPARPSYMPPVVPGTPGADAGHPARTPFAQPAGARPESPRPEASRPESPRPEAQRPEASRPESRRPEVPAESATPDRAADFTPANATERDLLAAADEHSTDSFLSTLLLATVLVPVADNSRPGSTPGESGFVFRTEEMDGGPFLVVFTSRDRLSEYHDHPVRTAPAKFLELIRNWPDPNWSFAVNPDSPVGAKYPGPQVIALASWADEAGLGAEPEERVEKPAPLPQRASDAAQHATVMQKTILPGQIDFFLERAYDRVAGFVHRANEVEHLRTPAELFAALGLVHEGSPFPPDAKEAFVLRWPAYRPSLYRIPYGGQSEQALRAMDGWVIERPPFRGNGFAPGEGRDVIAEFKVDSVRLPHGAQLWRMDADGTERMVAIFDADGPQWRKVGEQ
ncbi:SseB family protein [Actinoplanes sp. NPDC089786]|uniref:SseB family protein n=1 Tax=Actinoplanes sp. NPDC089786 TaxID=3155185 RepID=UPI00343DA5D9